MIVKDIVNLIDFPDDVVITIYSYKEWDIVFQGKYDSLDDKLMHMDIHGIEFPKKNNLLINVRED